MLVMDVGDVNFGDRFDHSGRQHLQIATNFILAHQIGYIDDRIRMLVTDLMH